MEYHAHIEKSEGWWIGWLVDLPGVNAQERTRAELLESLTDLFQEKIRQKPSAWM